MMINPGTNDSSAVFALLSAIKDPETAKASLQEILEASAELNKAREDFKAEKDAAYAEVNALREEAKDKLATATSISDNFDKKYAKQSKELSDLDATLTAKKFAAEVTDTNQNARDVQLKTLANQLDAREKEVSAREQTANALTDKANSLIEEYSSKLASLKAIAG